jgi:hypothetical protein
MGTTGRLSTGVPSEEVGEAQPATVKKSGQGNADEAQRIREALGYVSPKDSNVSHALAGGAAKSSGEQPAQGSQKKKKAKKDKKIGDADKTERNPALEKPSIVGVTLSQGEVAGQLASAGKGAFSFGFKLAEAQVAAETENKIANIMMMDSATVDGYVPRRVMRICALHTCIHCLPFASWLTFLLRWNISPLAALASFEK